MRRGLSLVGGLALAFAVSAAGSTKPATTYHASFSSAAQPRAAGLFVGSLDGKTFSWRLTLNGFTGTPGSGTLVVGGKQIVLCRPCQPWSAGRLTLKSFKSPAVTLRLPSASITRPLVTTPVPTLQVELGDGSTLHLPATVQYAVTGVTGARVVLLAGGRTLTLAAGPGTVTLPDDKLLTGKRDLVFVLERPNGTRLANREARVTAYGVLLAGRR